MSARASGEAAALRRFVGAFWHFEPQGLAKVLALMAGRSLSEGLAYIAVLPLLTVAGAPPAQGLPASLERWLGITPPLPVAMAALMLAMGLRAALGYATTVATARHLAAYTDATRRRLYAALIRASWPHHAAARHSRDTRALTMQVEAVHSAAQVLLGLASTLLTVAAGVGAAIVVAPGLTLAGLGACLAAALVLVVTQRRAYRLGHATLETAHRLFDLLSSHFASVKLAKAFAIERRLERDFAARSEDFRKAGVALQVDAARSALLQELAVVALLVAAVTASVGVFRVASGELVVLIAVFSRLLPLVLGLNGGIRSLAGALPEHDELVDIEARARAASEPLADPGQRLPLTQAITLEDVSFAYPDTPGAPILDRVSLLVLAGTATGIIGASGAGKSTLLDVIAGLLAPTSGIVRIDGRSIDESLRPVWRAGITYVPQDAPLIHDTLRANLLIGNPEATDAEMWRVLELVGAAALVRGMADGLDTLAGDRGVRLSGGERQRLRLASALLRMPPVLILDEATSALSPADEAPIIAALGELRGRSTIVTVAHRESSVAWTDQVVSVSHGRLYCVALPGSVTASRADGSGAGTSAQGRLVMDIEAPRLPTHGKS